MYQKDYILRMAEMVAKLLAGLLGLINKKEYIRASEQLSTIYHDILKEDASFFRSIPETELTNKLLEEHNYTNGHLEILAELFNAEAELEYAQGMKMGSLEFSRKSLILFEFVDREMKTYSADRIEKMEALRRRIEELQNL
jgi:hypothetical protein